MIREATEVDIVTILDMSISFLNEAKIDIPVNKLDLYSWIATLIKDRNSTVIVWDEEGIKGAIAGSISPHYTNKQFLVANEFAWWVKPEYRGTVGKKLLKAFELWAVMNEADYIVMASLEELNPELIDRVYKGLGYKVTEHSYLKKV